MIFVDFDYVLFSMSFPVQQESMAKKEERAVLDGRGQDSSLLERNILPFDVMVLYQKNMSSNAGLRLMQTTYQPKNPPHLETKAVVHKKDRPSLSVNIFFLGSFFFLLAVLKRVNGPYLPQMVVR